MKSQSNKVQSGCDLKIYNDKSGCDVKIYNDKGSLALRFPVRHNALWEILDGKSLKGKPKCLGIGNYGFSTDNPDDCKRAIAIARQIESDLDHPEWDKLFDRTLAKYGLGGGKYAKLAEIIQLPGAIPSLPEITVGKMWDAYLLWKKTTIEETTFRKAYNTFTNAIEGKIWNHISKKYSISQNVLSTIGLDNLVEIDKALELILISAKPLLLHQLSEAFNFAKSKGLIVHSATENPFDSSKFAVPAITTQQKYADKVVNGETVEWHEVQDEESLELDRRSFTKDERDIIIKAFYESPKKTQSRFGPLIEFYFLTGCRTSEALPLTWKDIDFNRNLIRFNKSLGLNTGKVKDTKTGETRLFYFSENSRLKALLLEIKNTANKSLVFCDEKGKIYRAHTFFNAWRDYANTQTAVNGEKVTYHYPGIVSQLAREGTIGGYLSPYHTRHTYITLTAQANAANNNALLHIAASCGNSVDVILRHYLGVDESTDLIEV